MGVLSDKCTSRLGRRRPFIIAGAVFIGMLTSCIYTIVFAMILIPNSLDIGRILGDPRYGTKPGAIVITIFGFWILGMIDVVNLRFRCFE